MKLCLVDDNSSLYNTASQDCLIFSKRDTLIILFSFLSPVSLFQARDTTFKNKENIHFHFSYFILGKSACLSQTTLIPQDKSLALERSCPRPLATVHQWVLAWLNWELSEIQFSLDCPDISPLKKHQITHSRGVPLPARFCWCSFCISIHCPWALIWKIKLKLLFLPIKIKISHAEHSSSLHDSPLVFPCGVIGCKKTAQLPIGHGR